MEEQEVCMKQEHNKKRKVYVEVKKREIERYRKVYTVHESSWPHWHQGRNHCRLLLGLHHWQPQLRLPALWGALRARPLLTHRQTDKRTALAPATIVQRVSYELVDILTCMFTSTGNYYSSGWVGNTPTCHMYTHS